MDNLVYEESLNTEVEHSEFINKKWVYVNDNNNGNYTSQIVLDSTPLSNSGGWINWSEGFILMPLVVQLTSATAAGIDATTPDSTNFSWAFKSGFWHMIHSMSVEFNNQNIIQTTPFTNVFRSFKANTTFSLDDLKNHGASTGFHPDTFGSWGYQDATANTALDGRGFQCGITNNLDSSIQSAVLTAGTGATVYVGNSVVGDISLTGACSGADNGSYKNGGSYSYNAGMLKRQEWFGYNAGAQLGAGGVVAGSLNQGQVNDVGSCATNYRAYKVNQVAGSASWIVYAKLRLKDLADFFEKVPLLKGSTIRFLINTNQSIVNFTTVRPVLTAGTGAIATSAKLTINSVGITGGNTCPLMVCANNLGSGGSCLLNDTYNLSVSIYQNTNQAQASNTTTNNTLMKANTPVRLYAPVYTMNPLSESKYLSLAPTKRVLYKDIFQYQYNNIAADESFNFLVSNGVNRIKSVCVIPFVAKVQSTAINTTFDAMGSPVNTTPANPDPIMLTNFNILVSGVNLFLSNQLYDFEQFREQLMSSNQLNGNLTTGLSSGLISEDDFARGCRYYYGDCSRALPSEENVARSVQIIGQNISNLAINLMIFIEFQKEITIDVSTGARID